MTDHGFWDIEANQTNNITYSYRSGKSYNAADEFNKDTTKLIDPTIPLAGTTKYCEYSSKDGKYGIDRLWKPTSDGNWYKCDGIKVDGESKQYRNAIVVNRVSLPFYRATENFAVYNSNNGEPVHILVNLSVEQFKNLMFSDAQLTNYFIEWLYEQVTHSVPTGGTTRGEWYLHNNHFNEDSHGFIYNLEQSLAGGSGLEFGGLSF